MNLPIMLILDRESGKYHAVPAFQGAPGTSIESITIDEKNHLIVTLTDGTTKDAGELPSGGAGGAVISVNEKTGEVVLTAEDVGARPDDWMPSAEDVGADPAGTAQKLIDALEIPENLADLTEDADHRTVTDKEKQEWSGKEEAGTAQKLVDALDIPVKTSDLENDSGFITEDDIPDAPVTSVCGKTGAVDLSSEDVGADPAGTAKSLVDALDIPNVPDWALAPNRPTYTYSDVGADQVGAAGTAVAEHNVDEAAHNDIRLFIQETNNRLNTFMNSEDIDLDQAAEFVAYMKANRSLIESITTAKISYEDIVNNLTTNVSNKPLSAAQGVALKALIDGIKIPTNVSEFTNDMEYYNASNPPPYPVTSVNGRTGALKLGAADIGADTTGTAETIMEAHLEDEFPHYVYDVAFNAIGNIIETLLAGYEEIPALKDVIPTTTSDLKNDSGYLDSSEVNMLIAGAIGNAIGGEY